MRGSMKSNRRTVAPAGAPALFVTVPRVWHFVPAPWANHLGPSGAGRDAWLSFRRGRQACLSSGGVGHTWLNSGAGRGVWLVKHFRDQKRRAAELAGAEDVGKIQRRKRRVAKLRGRKRRVAEDRGRRTHLAELRAEEALG